MKTITLAAGPEMSGIQDCMSCTPTYLTVDIHLVFEYGRHLLRCLLIGH